MKLWKNTLLNGHFFELKADMVLLWDILHRFYTLNCGKKHENSPNIDIFIGIAELKRPSSHNIQKPKDSIYHLLQQLFSEIPQIHPCMVRSGRAKWL